MKPSEEFLAELWGAIDHYVGVRLTWDESAADVDEMAKVKSTIERLIAEREKEARIEGMVALGNAIHAVDDGNEDVLATIDRLIAEERARTA